MSILRLCLAQGKQFQFAEVMLCATLQWNSFGHHARFVREVCCGFASVVVCVTVASFWAWCAGKLRFVLRRPRIRNTEFDRRSHWTAFEVVHTFELLIG